MGLLVGNIEAGIAELGPSLLAPISSSGCSSTVEPQPSKLMVWVRFPSPAPKEARGWVIVYCPHSSVVEHFLGKEEVSGSSPDVGSRVGLGLAELIFLFVFELEEIVDV